MRIVEMTESEAANSAVMKNVAEFLLTGQRAAIAHVQIGEALNVTTGAKVVPAVAIPISPADVPDAGLPPIPGTPNAAAFSPAVPPVPTPPAPTPTTPDPATIGFGAGGLPAPQTQGAVPAAPASAAAPSAPALPSAPAPAGVDVDTHGLPWNAKIHASTKAKNKDGSWRKRQGVDEAAVAAEEANMRAVMAIPAPAAAQTQLTIPQVPAVPAVPQVPAVPAVPQVPAPPHVAQGGTGDSDPFLTVPDDKKFAVWMEELTPAMTSGIVTPDFMKAHLEHPLGHYSMRPDLIPPARAAVRAALVGTAGAY